MSSTTMTLENTGKAQIQKCQNCQRGLHSGSDASSTSATPELVITRDVHVDSFFESRSQGYYFTLLHIGLLKCTHTKDKPPTCMISFLVPSVFPV